MDYLEWVKKLQEEYAKASTSHPNLWSYAYAQREHNPDEGLANAEHYLWAQRMAEENPIYGIFGPLLAAGYYGGKKAGLLGGRSPASLEQVMAGSRGAMSGLFGGY